MSFLKLNKQTTNPSPPAANKITIFSKLKKLFLIDEDGLVSRIGMPPQINGFRLTPQSGVPVFTSDNTGYGTIYLTPYNLPYIGLYNGATWDVLESAEVSLAVSGRTTDLPFDIFAYNNAGVVTLEFLDRSNATTRATALALQDGVLVKSGATTRRYLGSCRARSATTYSMVAAGTDAPCRFDLWNYYNRIDVGCVNKTTADTWNYTTATWRQAQGSTNYQIDIMVGRQEDLMDVRLITTSRNSTISIARYSGIGYDVTNAISGICGNTTNGVNGNNAVAHAELTHQPTIGRHFYSRLEYSVATGTCTRVGDDAGVLQQSGMLAHRHI